VKAPRAVHIGAWNHFSGRADGEPDRAAGRPSGCAGGRTAPGSRTPSAPVGRRCVSSARGLAAGAAAKTIANYHGLLSAICGYAVGKGVRAANPCVGTPLPRADGFSADGDPVTYFLEPSEFRVDRRGDERDRDGCGSGPDHARGAHRAAVGGLVALRVGDVNLVTRTLSVRRALQRDDTGQWVFGPPKTVRSRRSISLAPALVDLMQPHLAGRQADELAFFNGSGTRSGRTTSTASLATRRVTGAHAWADQVDTGSAARHRRPARRGGHRGFCRGAVRPPAAGGAVGDGQRSTCGAAAEATGSRRLG